MRYKCTISVANSYLRIHGYAEEFARKILLPFCHHHLFKFGMIPSESNPMIQTYGVTHRFARFNKDKTELRITSTLLPDLKNFITQRGYSDNDILIDEAHHIKFQNERMHIIFQRKSFYNRAISIGLYGLLFFGTIHAIWFGHKRAFIAGGVSKKDFMRQMYYKFFRSMQFLHASHKEEQVFVPKLAVVR